MSLAEEMEKAFLDENAKPTLQQEVSKAEEQALEGQHSFVSNAFEDLGSALYDWAKGAVAGAEEVGRAASVRGAELPADYLDEQALEKPELTPAQQATEDWYQKAVDTFNDETTKPVMVAAALSGLPGVSQLGAMAMLPMMAEDWSQNVEKEGAVQGTVSTALNIAPIVGSVRQALDPNFQKFADAHPARAAGLLLMNEAPWLAGAVQTAKHVRLNTLTEKFKGNVKKAAEALKKEDAVANPPRTETLGGIKADVARDTKKKFKPEKPKTAQEEMNMSAKPKVAEEIDKSIYDKTLEREHETVKAEKVHRGAYDQDIEAIPPTDMSITSVTIREIYETANRIVTSRIGNLISKNKETLGHYRPKEKIVNVGDTLNLDTLSHEVGHHIDTVLKIEGHDAELVNGAKSRWKHGEYDAQEKVQPGTWRGEGIAEFTAEYALNPEAAKQNFPGYYADFVKKLADQPELAADFEKMCQQIRLWKTMSPEERIRGNMSFASDLQKPATQQLLDKADAVKTAWIDSNTPFKKAIDDYTSKVGIALLNSENPAELAAAVKNVAPARATLLLGFFHKLGDEVGISALEKWYNVPLKKVSLGTVYDKLRTLNADKGVLDYLKTSKYKNIHEAFASYSAALHSLDVMSIKNMERIEVISGKLEKFKELYNKITNDEVNLAKVLEELKDIDEEAYPELANVKHQIEAKMTDKNAAKRKEVLETTIDTLETTIKDIKEGRNDYKTFGTREDLQAVVDNAPKQFAELAQNLSDVTENLMTLAVKFGFVTADEAALIRKEYPHYVPLHRDFSLDRMLSNAGTGTGGKGKGFVNVDKPLYKLSKDGSTRTVLDPITELYKTTNLLIEAGERNKVGQAVAHLATLDKAGELVVEAGENPKAVRGIFSVWENGKKKNYQAIAPGLYEAVTGGTNGVASSGVLDAITGMARKGAAALRIGATSTPMFMMWNGIRDTITASLYSKTGMLPLKGTLDGYMLRWDKELMADFMAQGVPYATFIGSNKDITKMFMDKTKLKTKAGKVADVLKKPFEAFEYMNEATEQAPRLSEFKRMYDRMLKQGYTTQEALFAAGQQARDLTVNFSQAGTYGREVNKYAAFFNAAVQGNYKLVKALGDDWFRAAQIFNDIRKGRTQPLNAVQQTIADVKAGKMTYLEAFRKLPLGTTAWALTSITLPSLALWSINHDKDWYKNMSYREKMTNWFIEVADGVIIRLPKPELPGYMFGSIPERIMDKAMDQDSQAVLNSTMGAFLFDSVTTSPIPTAVLPLLEWGTNWSFFRQRPIVDARYQKLEKPDQYNIYTSEMAKYAGQTFGESPMLIDNAFRDVTGSLGSFFLEVTNSLTKETQLPERDWRDRTRFTYNPTPNSTSRSSDVFYEGLDRLSKKFNTEVVRGLRKKNQKPKELKGLESAKKQISDLNKIKGLIMNGQGKYAKMDRAERKQERDKIMYKIDEIQRKANNKYLGYSYVPEK